MPNNRFNNLRKAKPSKQTMPPPDIIAIPQKESVLVSNGDLTEIDTPKRGRPRAKRSSDDFAQATAYIKKETYTAVKHLLLDQKKEYSVLVQELLDDWVQKQK